MFRAVVLFAFAALPFAVSSEDLCPPQPVVEYYNAETEEQLLREDLVGVWFIEEAIRTPTDAGIVYALFITEAQVEHDIGTVSIAEEYEGGTRMITLDELEARYEAMAMN